QMKLNTLTHFAKQDIYFLFGMEILISNKKLSIAKPVIGYKKFLFCKFNDTEISKIFNMLQNASLRSHKEQLMSMAFSVKRGTSTQREPIKRSIPISRKHKGKMHEQARPCVFFVSDVCSLLTQNLKLTEEIDHNNKKKKTTEKY
ncbi:hypothetical protein G9L32_002851, partial [Enterococcus faecalis]|nr:hypothetical protein [Enterococcus faecalis]